MDRRLVLRALGAASTLTTITTLAGCAGTAIEPGWTVLIDGDKGLDNFDRLGDANWRAEGGAVVADKGKGGYLVTKADYRDFALRAEFFAQTDTNSGIFLRCTDRRSVTADNAYEVNIWDIRPDPRYGTGAIVNFAAVPVPLTNKAGGRWNTFEIEARGPRVVVKLNGAVTTSMDNGRFPAGPIALQYGAGVQGAQGGPIQWRRVLVKAL
jgi:hypothetical protein